jgi:GDPmannose 4,6-dehydratase
MNTKKKPKRALITGITGQDGSYLSEFLLGKGYKVYGLVRRSSNDPFIRYSDGKVLKCINILYGNLRDSASLERAITEADPDEIYNLAAQSDVGISFKIPEETAEINYYGLGRLVNAVLKIKPDTKIYQASTSEMFGRTPPPQNEKSSMVPVSPYAEAKMKAHRDYVVGYRKEHGLFICSGILFNHESPRRGEHFVTRKITLSLCKIKLGLQDVLELGNLGAKRDWGYAGDYVQAMWKILQEKQPEDFVIATGKTHTVREFVAAAGKRLGLKLVFKGKGVNEVAVDEHGRVVVRVNPKYYRPVETNDLQGDVSKARKILKWQPTVDFNGLVDLMIDSDLALLQKGRADHVNY